VDAALRASRFERGLRWALGIALVLGLAHPVYRALHLGVEYYDGYDYLRSARALVGDPLLEYQPLRPPFVPIVQTPAMAVARASPPASPVRLIAPHLTGAVVSILSAGGVLWLFSRTVGASLALLGTLLFVATRYFVHYAPHVMADLPSAGWAAATVALYLRAGERRSPGAFALCGLALGCCVLTKYPLVVLGPALLLAEGWRAAVTRRIDWQAWKGVALACALGAGLFLAVQLALMWIVVGADGFAALADTLSHLPSMTGAGEIPGESWLDHGPMLVTMMSLPTLLLAGAGFCLAVARPQTRDFPCLAALVVLGGTTLFLVTHTEARYLLPAVPFLIYFALRSVEAALAAARLRWRSWSGPRRAALLAIGALWLAAPLRVGLDQARLEEDPLYRADLERRAAELLLAARRGDGRLLWHGRWYTLHTRWVGMLPYDEFFGIYHFPAFAIPYFMDQPVDAGRRRWPIDPDKLALVLKDGDAVLRSADADYDVWRLPPGGLPPMEVRSARRLAFRAESASEFVAATDPAFRIRLQPDGRAGVISASPLSGRWQILVRSAEGARPRFAGTVTLAPGAPAEFSLRGRAPVREIELFQLRATRIE
jgi:4-amino-4-deoxy-L-arabinose transferase-like glycosyltransferase